tara:strand:+ start:6056 stop:6643 length:588 start_codon:yes stop_codon:yes gene_type:complete
MKFNTSGHEVVEKNYTSPFLTPGIHTARIQKIEFKQSNGGTEGITIVHEGKPMEELDGKGQTTDTTLWLSAKAWPYTKDRLVVMADKLGVRETLDGITAENSEDYATALNGVFAGKSARWKFAGTEIAGKEGKSNWFKAEMAAFGFCEPLTVSEDSSKLTFDENDKYDMKRLAPADLEAINGGGDSYEDTEESPW